MKRRQRKFVGVILTLIIVVVWALGAMMLSLVSFTRVRRACCSGSITPSPAWAGCCL